MQFRPQGEGGAHQWVVVVTWEVTGALACGWVVLLGYGDPVLDVLVCSDVESMDHDVGHPDRGRLSPGLAHQALIALNGLGPSGG